MSKKEGHLSLKFEKVNSIPSLVVNFTLLVEEALKADALILL